MSLYTYILSQSGVNYTVLQNNFEANTYTVSFFGHRVIEDSLLVEQRLERLLRRFLAKKEYVEFLVGRDGEFDQIVSSVIRRYKRSVRDDNSALVWVLPYPTAEFRDNEESFRQYYDEIEICSDAAARHFKNAHQTRNREMIDRSDLVVFCIQHEGGGAWQAMKYTRKQGIPYINITEIAEDDE